MPILTTATSHRTRATLQQVARSHANSRALSAPTREVFAQIADGAERNMFDPLDFEGAFFEAAGSCSTRAGQSMARRGMVSDLIALREHLIAGGNVKPVVHTLTVKTTANPDDLRRALLGLPSTVYVSTTEA